MQAPAWGLLVLLGLSLLPAACSPEVPEAARRGPNVVLIVVDTLRADHLQAFGQPQATSPALADFVSVATRYTHCLAPAPWTTPSTATILSGLHPVRHGSHQPGSSLADGVVSLAEVFAENGWQTAGFSFNPNVSCASRFDQGFQHFRGFEGRSRSYPDVSEMRADVADWLDESLSGRFFLYLQPMNAHGPYVVPPEHQADLLGRRPVGGFTYYGVMMSAILRHGEVERREHVLPAVIASLHEQYAAAVRYTTDELGRLLDDLRARGLYENSLIVLTADHGEELFEHGGFSHGYSLHDELLHVPLLVKLPGQRQAAQVDTTVSLEDIYPTLLRQVGLPLPCAVDGRPLPTPQSGPTALAAEERCLLFHVDWSRRCVARGLRLGRWKLLHVLSDYAGAEEQYLLYDLEADPLESTDVAAEHPELVVELSERLQLELAERARLCVAPPENVLGSLDQEALQALGYLGD